MNEINVTPPQQLRDARRKHLGAIEEARSCRQLLRSASPRSGEAFRNLVARYRAAQESAAQQRQRIRELSGDKAIRPSMGQELQSAFQEAFQPYTSAFKAVQSEWSQFSEGLQKTFEPFRDFREVIAAIPKDKLEELRRAIATIGEDFQKALDEEEKKFVSVLAKRGWIWIGLEDHYTRVELQHILRLNGTRKNKDIDAFDLPPFSVPIIMRVPG